MKSIEKEFKVGDKVIKNEDTYESKGSFICELSEENSKIYDDFMKEYYKLHERCPKCYSKNHLSTTICGYILHLNKEEEYKDINMCECLKCGDQHLIHDRIPSIEKLREEKLNKLDIQD